MIRLEDVSALNIIKESSLLKKGFVDKEEIGKAIETSRIKDYRQLEDLINICHPMFNNKSFIIMLKLIKENIEYANKKGITPEVFYSNNYGGLNIDDKTLKATEGKTFCRQLVINNPILGPSKKINQIRSLKISEAKTLLSKVVAYNKEVAGNNAFLDCYPNFTAEDIQKLIKAIDFYEVQIACQYIETGKTGVCLFGVNKEEREKIIEKQIKNIIYYIVNNAEECVWGELTDEQKEMMIYAIKNRNILENHHIISRLVNLIANYTTLKEIESGIKPKTLDRFIVR